MMSQDDIIITKREDPSPAVNGLNDGLECGAREIISQNFLTGQICRKNILPCTYHAVHEVPWAYDAYGLESKRERLNAITLAQLQGSSLSQIDTESRNAFAMWRDVIGKIEDHPVFRLSAEPFSYIHAAPMGINFPTITPALRCTGVRFAHHSPSGIDTAVRDVMSATTARASARKAAPAGDEPVSRHRLRGAAHLFQAWGRSIAQMSEERSQEG